RLGLHQRAHRHPLRELVAQGRKSRRVHDARGERRRNRHDYALPGERQRVRVDLHAAAADLRDPARGRAQEYAAAAELVGHPDRHELRAADEALLLRASAGVEVALEAALVLLVTGRGDIEEGEQERYL